MEDLHQIKPTSKKEIWQGVDFGYEIYEINTSDKAYQLVDGILTKGWGEWLPLTLAWLSSRNLKHE